MKKNLRTGTVRLLTETTATSCFAHVLFLKAHPNTAGQTLPCPAAPAINKNVFLNCGSNL